MPAVTGTTRSTSARDEAQAEELLAALSPLLADPPVAGNPSGLARARASVEQRLERLGFRIDHHTVDGHPPVVTASRVGATPHWIGLSGHYDVEEEGPGWTTSAFIPVRDGDRLRARGIADNLGPLLLRLHALESAVGPLPSLVWVLQGEEEIGSPAAHRIYPRLSLPPVALWLEETGYYELDGGQRLLVRGASDTTQPWIDAACASSTANDRSVAIHDRYLNKAFGAHRCPFLTHLVGDATYLAIGPNDPGSRIHQSAESLAVPNLAASVDQFLAVLEAASA